MRMFFGKVVHLMQLSYNNTKGGETSLIKEQTTLLLLRPLRIRMTRVECHREKMRISSVALECSSLADHLLPLVDTLQKHTILRKLTENNSNDKLLFLGKLSSLLCIKTFGRTQLLEL